MKRYKIILFILLIVITFTSCINKYSYSKGSKKITIIKSSGERYEIWNALKRKEIVEIFSKEDYTEELGSADLEKEPYNYIIDFNSTVHSVIYMRDYNKRYSSVFQTSREVIFDDKTYSYFLNILKNVMKKVCGVESRILRK